MFNINIFNMKNDLSFVVRRCVYDNIFLVFMFLIIYIMFLLKVIKNKNYLMYIFVVNYDIF